MALNSFPDRLKLLIGSGTTTAFAKKSEIGEATMRSYLDGRSVPGLDKAVAIAERSRVNLLWLATGEGPKDLDAKAPLGTEQAVPVAIDSELLASIIGSIILWQQNDNTRLDTKNVSELSAVLYKDLSSRISEGKFTGLGLDVDAIVENASSGARPKGEK